MISENFEEELIASEELMFPPHMEAPTWRCIPEHEHKFHHPNFEWT